MNMFVKPKPITTVVGSHQKSAATINSHQLAGTPGAGTPAVRLQVLQDIVKADKAVPLPADNTKLRATLEQNSEVRGPTAMTPTQVAAGNRINRVSIALGGNSHFNGWHDSVGKDTQVVIAKGSAYAGKSVEVNGEVFDNAALIYMKKPAGLSQTTFLDIIGKPGEEVELLALRVQTVDRKGNSVPTQFDVAGNELAITGTGGNTIGGDAYWRHVKVKIENNDGPSLARFNHFHADFYHPAENKKGLRDGLSLYCTDAQGKLIPDAKGHPTAQDFVLNVNGSLAGDADARLHPSVVTPM